MAYNPDVAYNWGNDPKWADAIDAAVDANPNASTFGYASEQIVYYNPNGAFMVFTINQDAYWR